MLVTELQVMGNRYSIQYKNATGRVLTAVIEPWAVQFRLPPASSCEVFSVGGTEPGRIDIELVEDSVIFFVETDGAVYEYWQDGVFVD